MINVGVDGCKTGWIAITRSDSGLYFEIFPSVASLAQACSSAARIFIDIPIGLPFRNVPVRPCDRRARQLLGRPRGSSVFAVPCRSAVHSSTLEEARSLNIAEIDRSLGAQTWAISPKIAEVDKYLAAEIKPGQLGEIHPEVCFWALAGKRAMVHKKSTVAGIEERLQVLEPFEPSIRFVLRRLLAETQRKAVAADDLLDAAVAFVTAEARVGRLAAVVEVSQLDLAGRPMNMQFLETG